MFIAYNLTLFTVDINMKLPVVMVVLALMMLGYLDAQLAENCIGSNCHENGFPGGSRGGFSGFPEGPRGPEFPRFPRGFGPDVSHCIGSNCREESSFSVGSEYC